MSDLRFRYGEQNTVKSTAPKAELDTIHQINNSKKKSIVKSVIIGVIAAVIIGFLIAMAIIT